jgi:type I restriction enzyme S subunit
MSAREEDLPDGWCSVPLSGLGTWSGGGTPSKENPAFWRDGSIPWISPKDMKVDRIHVSEDHITEEAIRRSAAKRLPSGSVLFVTRSGILAHTFPVAVTTVDVTVNQDLKAVTPHLGLSPDYVAWGSRALGGEILRRCSKDGTTVASIDTEQLMRFELPIAPPPEQHRIVEAIESYFTRLDDAVATLGRVQRNLKRYRASVLKAAVEGRLVRTEAELARAEGRDYEPASVLLERILTERRRRWQEAGGRGKYSEPVAPDTAALPELSEGWCYASLPQLGELNRGKSKHRPRNDPRLLGGPYPFIQTGDVRNADGVITSHEATYSDFGLAQSRLWPVGTLCITIAANIAETGILRFDACFPDSVVGFLQDDPLITRYVEFFIRTAREKLAQYAPATAQKNINLQTLSEIAVPLPPTAEQARIVAEVDRQFSVARHCHEVALKGGARCARLRQSILKWAFEGKLADQDPGDEPASVLLERIRAETAARMASDMSGAPQKRRGRRGTMTGTKHRK